MNEITVENNVEIIEKLCNFVTGRMVHLTSTYEILHGIEKQVKLFTENRCKKIKMQENLGHEFEKFKTNLAENISLEYNLPPLPVKIRLCFPSNPFLLECYKTGLFIYQA